MKHHIYTILLMLTIIFLPNLIGQFMHYLGVDYFSCLNEKAHKFGVNWIFGMIFLFVTVIVSLFYYIIYLSFKGKN